MLPRLHSILASDGPNRLSCIDTHYRLIGLPTNEKDRDWCDEIDVWGMLNGELGTIGTSKGRRSILLRVTLVL